MLLIRVHSLFFFLVAFLGLFSYFLSHLIHSHQRLYYLYLSSQRSKVTVCPYLWSCCTDKKRPHYVKKTHYFSIWSRLSVLSKHEMVRQSPFFSLLMKRLTNVSTKNAFSYVKKSITLKLLKGREEVVMTLLISQSIPCNAAKQSC